MVPNKSNSKTQLIIVTLFVTILATLFVRSYGLLLAYFNARGFILLFLAGYGCYWVSKKFDAYINADYKKRHRLNLLKSIATVGIFTGLFYLLFYIQPDKLLIAYVMGIPVEALNPCSDSPLAPEIEKIAREVFNLKETESFDDRYCNSHTSDSSN